MVRSVATAVVNRFLPKDNDCSKSDQLIASYQLDEDAAVPGPVEGMKLFFAREALIVLSPRTESVCLRD